MFKGTPCIQSDTNYTACFQHINDMEVNYGTILKGEKRAREA
jgi:hypothetical protein